jgi:hypothetical protein
VKLRCAIRVRFAASGKRAGAWPSSVSDQDFAILHWPTFDEHDSKLSVNKGNVSPVHSHQVLHRVVNDRTIRPGSAKLCADRCVRSLRYTPPGHSGSELISAHTLWKRLNLCAGKMRHQKPLRRILFEHGVRVMRRAIESSQKSCV